MAYDERGAEDRREVLPMAEEWLTLAEAAAYLKVAKPTIYRLCEEGCLPFYKLAGIGQRRFKRADLDALLVPGQRARRSGDADVRTAVVEEARGRPAGEMPPPDATRAEPRRGRPKQSRAEVTQG